MEIILNGKPLNIEPGTTVSRLLEEQEFNAKLVAVAVNFECVSRSKFDETEIRENDEVEVLSPMQGG